MQLAWAEVRVLGTRLVGLSLLLWAPLAFAAELRWKAPAECAAHEFTTRLEALLGRSLSQVEDRQLRVDVERTSDRKWALTFAWVDASGQESGQRRLHGAGCADVARGAAVAAALALQADEAEEKVRAVDQVPQVSEAAHASTAPAASEAPAPMAAPTPVGGAGGDLSVGRTAVASESGLWLARVALVGDSGTLEDPVLGASVEGGVRLGHLSFGLGLAGLPTTRREVSPGRGGEFYLVAAQVWGCARSASPSWVPTGCVAYEVGALSGRGAGDRVTRNWSRSASWHALQPQLGIGIPLGAAFELDVRLGISVALTRPDFVLDGEDSILRPRALSPRGAVGLRWAP